MVRPMDGSDQLRAIGAPMARRRVTPYLLLALTSLFWAGNWIVGRALREAMPPVALNTGRWAGACLILAPFVLPRLKGRWGSVRRHWRILALLGGLGAALFQCLVYLGLEETNAVNAVLMNSSVPLFIILCSWALEGETPTARQLAGLAVSTFGILVIMSRGAPQHLLAFDINRGDLIILAAMPAWGIYSVALKRRPKDLAGIELVFVLALFGLLCLMPFLALELAFVRLPVLSLASAGGILYVALFASVLGYVCWNAGVAAIGANRAGFTIHLLPAFGTVLAILLLGEEAHPFHLVGIATILAGVALATSARRR
jgi:drug/metabolite transporter (DMT)-like permease